MIIPRYKFLRLFMNIHQKLHLPSQLQSMNGNKCKNYSKEYTKWGPWHISHSLLIHWVQKRFWRMSLSYQIAPFLLLCLYLISLLSLGFCRIEISIWDLCNNEDQSVSFCIIGIRAIACKWVPLGFLHFKRHSILHIFI